jgi:hypothetical protein
MSQTKYGEVNELLAKWGRLLKVRHELRSAGMISYRVIYTASWDSSEQIYDAECGHYAEDEALYEAFTKNIEENLEGIERKLKVMGVTIAKPVFER